MKTQPTTRCLLRMILCVLALSCRAWAGQFFFDDFTDGNAKDGSPVNWVPRSGDATGYGYVLTPEGLEVNAAQAGDAGGTLYVYRDVSARVQIKRISNHTDAEWVSGLTLRWGGPTGGYWIEVRPPNRFWLGHMKRYVLRSATLPFNVDERELIIRVDAVGAEIKCWCWPADESMPETPQITLIDDVTPDGTFGLYAGTQGGKAIYRWVEAVSTEVPIVDFDGNGQVDIQDLLKMIGCWGQEEPSIDLSGDGTVDADDLEILMKYWGQELEDPTLIAHWALDEAEGRVASDSAGTNDGTLVGNPLWQPSDGALLFDGSPGFVTTPFVCDPSAGPFSALAWVKGGAPGRVILAQANGACWLKAAGLQGALMTELKGPQGGPLVSPTVITDGAWHRVGLVWDGSNRILCVDGLEVIRDKPGVVAGSNGGLAIGGPADPAQGGFWSGLIDDVRIYNRAVKP
jgi:hypothetical protein